MDVKRTIDINCDLGEGMPNDADLMPFISSCNIACGGHFGTKETIRKTIKLAHQHNVKVGAHPSYPDNENFGRKELKLESSALAKSIKSQIALFLEVCNEENVLPHHIKLHGALYNVAAREEATAQVIVDVIQDMGLKLPVYAPHDSFLSKKLGQNNPVVAEAFIDRRYNENGSLVSRKEPNALIESPELAWKQLNQLFFDQEITVSNGTTIPMISETFCLHGDAENALKIAQFINTKLNERSIILKKVNKPRVSKYGHNAILVEWEAVISPEVNQQVLNASSKLEEKFGEAILEIVSSYNSLVVFLKEEVQPELLRSITAYSDTFSESFNTEQANKSRVWLVPVCYDPSFGLDLESLSELHELSNEAIVKLHTERAYRIYGIGFLPGFLYLGGLNEQLFSPRKRVVNRFAPKGSVAIGGEQTGIYPQESPGGWNIIGRTPIELFDPRTNPPTSFSAGDSVRFVEINLEEFAEIEEKIRNDQFELTFTLDD